MKKKSKNMSIENVILEIQLETIDALIDKVDDITDYSEEDIHANEVVREATEILRREITQKHNKIQGWQRVNKNNDYER